MRSKLISGTALLAISLGQFASAANLPERIDFRKDPAWVILRVNERLWARFDKEVVSKCSDHGERLAASEKLSVLYKLQKSIEERIQISNNLKPTDDGYSDLFKLVSEQDKDYLSSSTAINEQKKKVGFEEEKFKRCELPIRSSVFDVVDLYSDASLTQRKAQLRFSLMDSQTQIRILPSEKWEDYFGDYVPGGESSYYYQTVLEKSQDKLLIPVRPFASPLWFDYKKSFGQALQMDDDHGLTFLFPRKGKQANLLYYRLDSKKELIPDRIQGSTAIFRQPIVDTEENDEASSSEDSERKILKALKEGLSEKIPLDELFGKDQHLLIVPISGC